VGLREWRGRGVGGWGGKIRAALAGPAVTQVQTHWTSTIVRS